MQPGRKAQLLYAVCLELAVQEASRLSTQLLFCRGRVTSLSSGTWWWGVHQTKIPSLIANSEVPDTQVATCVDPGQRQGSVLAGEAGVCVGGGDGTWDRCLAWFPVPLGLSREPRAWERQGDWLVGCRLSTHGLYLAGSCVLPSSFFSWKGLFSQKAVSKCFWIF